MATKFIPNGDFDFVTKAEAFAKNIAADPARLNIAQDESEAFTQAVKQFRQALQEARTGARSQAATRRKEDTRATAEQLMRRLGHIVRSNLKLDAATKITLGIQPRAETAKILPCPQEPPRLRFLRAHHEGNGATPMHELSFEALDFKSKPPGAVRLELFVDLVPPDEPIPGHPGANLNSRPWYLRSYTRSPIKLIPPIARVPMRVVYWGRWADTMGNTGPFSATCAAWIEGGSNHYLPGGVGMRLGRAPIPILDAPREPGSEKRDRTYVVAVLEAQVQSVIPALHAPEAERKMLPTEATASPVEDAA
jgi:hypothetical protein